MESNQVPPDTTTTPMRTTEIWGMAKQITSQRSAIRELYPILHGAVSGNNGHKEPYSGQWTETEESYVTHD